MYKRRIKREIDQNEKNDYLEFTQCLVCKTIDFPYVYRKYICADIFHCSEVQIYLNGSLFTALMFLRGEAPS